MKKAAMSRQRGPRLRSFRDIHAFILSLGGVEGLIRWARASDANRKDFYLIWARVMLKEHESRNR